MLNIIEFYANPIQHNEPNQKDLFVLLGGYEAQ